MTVKVARAIVGGIIGLYVVGVDTGVGWDVTQPMRSKPSKNSLNVNRILYYSSVFVTDY